MGTAAIGLRRKSAALCLLAVFATTLFLPGCSDNNQITYPDNDDLKIVEHTGKLPDEFKKVVENNIFYDVTAFDGRLLKSEIRSVDKENRTVVQQVRMMDVYGKDLAVYECSSDDAHHVTTLTATEDGGFLFVLGFNDYSYSQTEWASDKGFASRVIKCDKDGNLQFDTPFVGLEGAALKYCFEKNGLFYLFGEFQTPDQSSGYTDISMVILDQNGNILKKQSIAGSNFDNLYAAEISGDCFVLSVRSQSDDGDFAGSNSNGHPVKWVITVNDDLEITKKKQKAGRDYLDLRIGERDGVPVYKSDTLLIGFDAGGPEAFIDYGDFYLIVSENITGVYENTPLLSSNFWFYTETVYSAYDENGNLIFRASVDSSPDYDAWVQELATR